MTLANKTRRILVAAIACLCCLSMVLLLCPLSLLPVKAAAPQYMLKMDMSKEADQSTERPLFTSVRGLESGTYEFSFDYYSTATPAAGSNIYSVSWAFWQDAKMAGDHIHTGNGTAKVRREFTATQSNDGRMTMGIDLHGQVTGGVIYAWNFKLVKEGSNENLLANPDFKNGSLKDWNYAFSGWYEQDANPDPNGVCSAVEYDETLIGLDDGKTYMLKMDMSKEADLNTERPLFASVSGLEDGTYVFSFDYYNTATALSGAFYAATWSFWNLDKQADGGSIGSGRGSVRMTRTFTNDSRSNGRMTVGIDQHGQMSGGVFYAWNFKLVKEGSNENLLANPDFKNGSLKDWNYAYTGWYEQDANPDPNGVCSAVEYDESLFSDDEPDDGKTYMLKMDMSKEADLNTERPLFASVSGLENGTYVFSFDYYNTATAVSGAFYAATWSFWNLDKQADGGTIGSGRGSVRMTRTFTNDSRSNGRMTVGIDQHGQMSGGVFYAWNFKLVKEGSDENLLVNPDFKNGSLKDWNYAYTGWYEQDANPDPNGVCSAVEYDESLFVHDDVDDGKTYMLKIDGSSPETIWARLTQPVTAPEDGTYEYTFQYYRSLDSTGVMLARGFFGEEFPFQGNLANGKNTYRAEADFHSGDTFQIGFDRQDGTGIVYIWDLKLVKKGGDGTNLLKNPGFRNGKLNDWGAPGASVSGPYTVLEYDESLLTTVDPDDGKTYMIKTPGAGNVLQAEDYEEGMGNWIFFGQAFRVKMGDTYTFSYNYYTERTTTALARVSPLTAMDQPVVQTLMAHYIEGKMVVTFRVGEQQGHGGYMGEMTEEQKQQALYDPETDTVFLWFGVTPGYYGDSYLWNLSLTKEGSDVNLFDNPNFQRGGGTMAGWFLNGTNPGAVQKRLGFEVSELNRDIWKDKIIEVVEQEDPRDPNVHFTMEFNQSDYDADHRIDANPQNGGNGYFAGGGGGADVDTGDRQHTAAYVAVSVVCAVLLTGTVVYPRIKRKKEEH